MEQDTWTFVLRRPVKREGAGRYMVLVLVSFAVSVSVTRLFLSITGYPQIGGSELHIAHVLWGGLMLFIAALLPLLISNRRAYRAAAILAGVGIGLFIDEVGKFITQQNDYFYPAAAPIIYIFFMLTVLLVLQAQRREKATVRAKFCKVLETLQDWIYSPLEKKDQVLLIERLKNIKASADSDILSGLATDILNVVEGDPRPAPADRPDRWRLYIQELDQWISENGLRFTLAVGFLVMAAIAFKNPAYALLSTRFPVLVETLITGIHSGRSYGIETAPGLYQARVIMEITLGCALFVVSLLLFFKKPRIGVPLGFGLLLLYLATIDTLLFYFEQFSTILLVLYQLLLSLGLIYYRTRFTTGAKVGVGR